MEEHRHKDNFNRLISVILQTHTLADAYGTPDHTRALCGDSTDTDALVNKLLWLQEKNQIWRTISAVSRMSLLTKKGNEEYGWEEHTVKVMLPSLLFLTAYCGTSVSGSPTLNHVYQTCLNNMGSVDQFDMDKQTVVSNQAIDWAVPPPIIVVGKWSSESAQYRLVCGQCNTDWVTADGLLWIQLSQLIYTSGQMCDGNRWAALALEQGMNQ